MTIEKLQELKFDIVFYPVTKKPIKVDSDGECILYNQCDGYHLAYARFYEDGDFRGFYTFMGEEFEEDFYFAWAKLPPTLSSLFDAFSIKREKAA